MADAVAAVMLDFALIQRQFVCCFALVIALILRVGSSTKMYFLVRFFSSVFCCNCLKLYVCCVLQFYAACMFYFFALYLLLNVSTMFVTWRKLSPGKFQKEIV